MQGIAGKVVSIFSHLLESIEHIFNPLIQSCTLNMNEVVANQDKLSALLTKVSAGIKFFRK